MIAYHEDGTTCSIAEDYERDVLALEKELNKLRAALAPEVMARFWSKVEVLKKRQCWKWKSSISNGYGKFSINNYPHSAHVISFEYFNGSYDKSLYIDHICRNRACVNPNHLRLVTPRVNSVENSTSKSAINSAKTHCKQGHPFSRENTRMRKSRGRMTRLCKACCSTQYRARRAREFLSKHGELIKGEA